MITVVRQTALDHEMAPAVFLQDAINAACAQNADPVNAAVALSLGADTEEKQVAGIMQQLQTTAGSQNVLLTQASVSAFPHISRPILEITVNASPRTAKTLPEKEGDLVLFGNIALAGTAILAAEKKAELTERFSEPFIRSAEDFMKQLSVAGAAKCAFDNGAIFALAPGEGGIFSALWELGESIGAGLHVDLKAIPIRQETVEICECFRINPYLLLSTGALLIVTKNGAALCEVLAKEGFEASPIGTIHAGNDRTITNDGEIRYLDLPQTDEIYRSEQI